MLPNAPAQETIYTIRAIFAVQVELPGLREGLMAALKHDFTIVEDFNAFQTTVQQPASESPTVQSEVRAMGYRFKTADGGHVAHFMVDGLVVNWVKGAYPGYAECIKHLQRYWLLYQEHFKPLGVDHVALRYINHLRLPLNSQGGLDFNEFLRHVPTLPPIEGLSFNGYQQFSELVKQPEGIRTRVMSATLNPEDHHLPMLFDYESFLTLVEKDRRENAAIWQALNTLHNWCELFFNQTLTNKCHELFS